MPFQEAGNEIARNEIRQAWSDMVLNHVRVLVVQRPPTLNYDALAVKEDSAEQHGLPHPAIWFHLIRISGPRAVHFILRVSWTRKDG